MKAVMVLFDSLIKGMLPPYGCDWVKAPNFQRLAEHSVTFDNNFIGSMPCMPARRELHTGRYNFLHRGWGPLEPFDDSMPEILKKNKIYTHLTSDHGHYWEDGGATYHTRYSTWEGFRGQEGDPWKGEVKMPVIPETKASYKQQMPLWRQDWVNRQYLTKEEDMPQAKTFQAGVDFIDKNHSEDNWFLQIESFDPHEPYFTQDEYKKLYPHDYDGPHLDWPDYGPAKASKEEVDHIYKEYASVVSMCDRYLGKVLDQMDEFDLWKDTMLIVNTDHGFLLSEHGFYGKNFMPFYDDIANIPLFIWDPRSKRQGVRNNELTQMIDMAPTLLDFFGLEATEDMEGVNLKETLADDSPTRKEALFGIFGGQVNVTDGQYVYMRSPVEGGHENLNEYTLMPTRMHNRMTPAELKSMSLAPPFNFTKECKTLKIPNQGIYPILKMIGSSFQETALYDRQSDPGQHNPLKNKSIEENMKSKLLQLMQQNDAPKEQFERIGLIDK